MNGSNAVVGKYVRGIGLIKNQDNLYFVFNAHGDVTQLTNASGTVTKNYDYDAFGVEIGKDDSDENPFRYCGEYFDSSSGTYYLRNRYYSPELGRFTQQDGWANVDYNDPLSLNLYTYCINNPVRYHDSNGLFFEEIGNGLLWIGGKVVDGASAVVSTAIHVGDWVACTIGIDTAAAGAFALNMYKDGNGIYHASTDAWQQIGGYNSLYDAVFDFGTSMKAQYFDFAYSGQDFRFWAWKGDYINLGAGAELGIYKNQTVLGNSTPHWAVDRNYSLPMSMTLKDNKGNLIASYNPSESQWWITSFNPNYKNVNANNLSVSFTVNFSGNTSMFDAFYNEWSGKKGSPWTFDKKNYSATLNF